MNVRFSLIHVRLTCEDTEKFSNIFLCTCDTSISISTVVVLNFVILYLFTIVFFFYHIERVKAWMKMVSIDNELAEWRFET